MADLRRICPDCRRRFRPAKGTRRLYCETCRPSRVKPDDPAPVLAGPGAPGWTPAPIEARTLAELTQRDRADTLEAAVMLRLARELDSGKLSGAALATVSARLFETRQMAFEGTTPPERDRLDELAAIRAAKAETA